MVSRLAAYSRAVLVLGAIVMAFGAWSPFQVSENKVVQQDRGGPYVISNKDIATGAYRETNSEIRAFLWNHWSQRRRGCLTVTRFSKEGVAANATYLVGPDADGTWTIMLTLDRPALKGTNAEHTEQTIYSVRRVEPRRGDDSSRAFVPDDRTIPADAYRMIFYDKSGKEIGRI
jgi:hypothetical protein